MEVSERVAVLEQQLADLQAALFTQDDYIRYERLPQLTGTGITHEAGSGEVAVDVAKFYDARVPSSADFDLTTNGSSNVVNVTESGVLIGVGLQTVTSYSDATTSGWEVDFTIRFTVDGATDVDYAIVDKDVTGGGDNWENDPYAAFYEGGTLGGSWGQTTNARLYIPMNFAYQTSLRVQGVVASTDSGGGSDAWDLRVFVHRATEN